MSAGSKGITVASVAAASALSAAAFLLADLYVAALRSMEGPWVDNLNLN